MQQDILINWSPQETRVAVVEHGAVQELQVERTLERGLVGNVYLGKVVRVLPGMQSAFIDIGLERAAFLHVADLMSSINSRTYAVGLGTAQQVSTGALNALTNSTGGYLLLSGPLSTSVDDYFRLTKYFLQILAGVTNNTIVTDPAGYIAPGMKLRIPFVLNETDIDSTVILLTDLPSQVLNFLIETPAGDLMNPAQAGTLGATFAVGTNMSYYRFTLPLPLGGKPARDGTWYAVLEVDDKLFERYAHARDQSLASWSARMAHGVRYSVNAHALSNLRMDARISQNSLELGATMTIRATLTEYGIPADHRATIRAELQRPDGTQTTLFLVEGEPGVFQASTVAPLQGVYRFHVVASGMTMRGLPFTREQLLSGAVVPGGNNPFPTSGPSTRGQDEAMCQLLQCLLSGRNASQRVDDPIGIDEIPHGLEAGFDPFSRARSISFLSFRWSARAFRYCRAASVGRDLSRRDPISW